MTLQRLEQKKKNFLPLFLNSEELYLNHKEKDMPLQFLIESSARITVWMGVSINTENGNLLCFVLCFHIASLREQPTSPLQEAGLEVSLPALISVFSDIYRYWFVSMLQHAHKFIYRSWATLFYLTFVHVCFQGKCE